MRLRLFREVEFAEVKLGDTDDDSPFTTFRPRKILPEVYRDLVRRCTENGTVDGEKLDLAVLEYALGDERRPPDRPGWSDLLNGDGGELRYEAKAVPYVASHLPRGVLELIRGTALVAVFEEAEKLGNSRRSSGKGKAEDRTPSPS